MIEMKKNPFYWMLTAALLCGLSLTVTSCSDDDDDNNNSQENSTTIVGGDITDDEYKMAGCIAVTKVPRLQELMKHICRGGYEHHVAMVRGHVAEVLQEAVGNYLGWDLYVHE